MLDRPIRLLSLWDIMEHFKVEGLINAIRTVMNNVGMTGDQNSPIPHGFRELAIEEFGKLKEICDKLNLYVAGSQIADALKILNYPPNPGETLAMERAINMIATTIEKELSIKLILVFPPERAKFYTDPLIFGWKVDFHFPSATPEIAEAGKCIALGRYTAAVFHLMRTLEVGINALAAKLGVEFKNKNWQNILDQIVKQIRTISPTTHAPDWKEEEQFYSEAAAHFRLVKNAWRNYSMHLHERYDEERTMDIFNSTRAFMRHIATKLYEPEDL